MTTSNNTGYLAMLRAGRDITRNAGGQPALRLALLADHAPQQLATVLKAAVLEQGFFPELYVADYGTAALDAFDGESALHAWRPEVALYSIAVQKYRERFYAAQSVEERESLPERYVGEVGAVVDALLERGIAVLLSNFALPQERLFGNYGALTAQSLYGSVLRANLLLAEAVSARRNCQLHDVMYLANSVGAAAFLDERLWAASKYPCANPFLPDMARSMARAVAVRKGKVSKVLVLDLDNTLWGGVIAEDGMDGIALGGDAYGEAFQQFQRYLLALRDRGYVLAVCSKNDEDIATQVFREHPEMLIRLDDISVFVANWNDKGSNLDAIAQRLNLSPDSFIFIDDSAFERDLVRALMPTVAVPELPDDVADFCVALERSGLLEASGFTGEDRLRNAKYKEEAQRASSKLSFGNVDDYLASLDMRVHCTSFAPDDIPRVAQLMQRSTQFNLRTQRLSDADCERLVQRGEVTVAARLKDRFGDYGLIAAVACQEQDGWLFVSEFVMSCRVLKRGVEDYLVNHLFAQCAARGLAGIRGEYIASAKNGMVKDLFARLGFERAAHDETGSSWYLQRADYRPRPTHITEEA
ncbi:MAG: HAD-IIIC family phosphatase [Rhodocyclaceae bacterium]